jgi:hypothetical protein
MEEKHYSRVHLHAAAGDGDWFDDRFLPMFTMATRVNGISLTLAFLLHWHFSYTRNSNEMFFNAETPAQIDRRRNVISVQVEKALLQAILVLPSLLPVYYCNNLCMYGDSPLHLAVLKGRIDVVKYLLKV